MNSPRPQEFQACDLLHPFVSRLALETILNSPLLETDLGGLALQSYDQTLVVRVGHGKPTLLSCSDRVKYVNVFLRILLEGGEIPGVLTSCRSSDETAKPEGFVLSGRAKLGKEKLFVFRDRDRESVSVMVAPDVLTATRILSNVGKLHSFKRICCWCGSEGKFKKCPCKLAWYCNGDCQNQHWRTHKPKCTFQK